MANMNSSDRAQYERPDLSAPDRTDTRDEPPTGDRLHGARRPDPAWACSSTRSPGASTAGPRRSSSE